MTYELGHRFCYLTLLLWQCKLKNCIISARPSAETSSKYIQQKSLHQVNELSSKAFIKNCFYIKIRYRKINL